MLYLMRNRKYFTEEEKMTLYALCAAHWSACVIDIMVALGLVCATFVCGKKGFISCLFGIVSTLAAFLLAISLANVFLTITGGLFGLQGVFEGSFEEFFLKLEGFDGDISASGVQTALETSNAPAILARLVLKMTDGADVPAGTTLAQLLGEATASLAATLISGAVVFVLVKLCVFFMKKLLNGIVDKINLFRGMNRLLGSFFGLVYFVLIVSVALAVLAVIPISGIGEYISQTVLIKTLYEKNLLVIMLSWFI